MPGEIAVITSRSSYPAPLTSECRAPGSHDSHRRYHRRVAVRGRRFQLSGFRRVRTADPAVSRRGATADAAGHVGARRHHAGDRATAARSSPDPLCRRPSGTSSAPAGRALYLGARRAPWRAAAVYAGGGLFSAAVLAVAFLWSSGTEPSPLRFLVLLWVYLWPLVPTLLLTAATSRRDKALVTAGYVAVYAALTVATVVPPRRRGEPDRGRGSFELTAAAVWCAILAAGQAVGPLVVTFLLFAVTGAVLLPDLLGVNQTLLDGISDLFTTLGVGADATFVVLILIGLVIFAVLAWPVLQLVRRAYEKKRVERPILGPRRRLAVLRDQLRHRPGFRGSVMGSGGLGRLRGLSRDGAARVAIPRASRS